MPRLAMRRRCPFVAIGLALALAGCGARETLDSGSGGEATAAPITIAIDLANPGGSQGNLCLGGSLGRYNANIMNSGATGSFQIPLDLTMTPTSVGMSSVAAGETRYWQIWYRDANPTATSNFTDGVRVTFY